MIKHHQGGDMNTHSNKITGDQFSVDSPRGVPGIIKSD